MTGEETPKGGFSPLRFFSEVRAEMRKVLWPTRRELVNYSAVVAVAVAIVCALIWVCDTAFARVFHVILQ